MLEIVTDIVIEIVINFFSDRAMLVLKNSDWNRRESIEWIFTLHNASIAWILPFDGKQRVKTHFITVYETAVVHCQTDAELQNKRGVPLCRKSWLTSWLKSARNKHGYFNVTGSTMPIFTARRSYASAVLGVVILSVSLSVRRVLCD